MSGELTSPVGAMFLWCLFRTMRDLGTKTIDFFEVDFNYTPEPVGVLEEHLAEALPPGDPE